MAAAVALFLFFLIDSEEKSSRRLSFLIRNKRAANPLQTVRRGGDEVEYGELEGEDLVYFSRI